MRIIKLFLVTSGILILGIFFVFYFYIKQYGRALIEDQLNRILHHTVIVNEVGVVFPLGIRASGVQIPGVLSVKDMRIHLGLPVVLGDQIIIAKLLLKGPSVAIKRSANDQLSLGSVLPADLTPAKEKPSKNKSKAVVAKPVPVIGHVAVEYLEVEGGQVQYFDIDKDSRIERWDVDSIELKARNVVLPVDKIRTRFHLSGLVMNAESPVSGSQFETEGWINSGSRDLKANLKLADANNQMTLQADLDSVNNDLTVKGKFNAARLSSASSVKNDGQSIDDLVFGTLQSTGFDLVLDFNFKTKLDAFHIEPITFSGSVGADIAGNGLKPNLRNISRQFEDISQQLVPETSPTTAPKEVLAP